MSGVLVLYASTHGHTAKIARRIAEAVREAGREPDVREAKFASDVSPDDYAGVIVGGSIHGGHHQREVVDREYDLFTRTLIRLMMKRGGHPTDPSRDYDYTYWGAVEQFGRDFARSLAS